MTSDLQDDPEVLLLKRQRATLLKRKLELVKRFGLAYYRPFPKQDAFHRAGVRFKRRMIRSGNRYGKSTMGCAEDCAWFMNERSWYAESDSARRGGIPQHPTKILTITTDWDKVDEIWTSQKADGGKVWKMLPKDVVKSVRRNHTGAIDMIEGVNKSVWRFDTVKSFKANPLGSESSDWDLIHVDEPCPEDMFKASARGLVDRGGSAIFTLTPLTEFWINDYFFPQDTGGQLRDSVWADTGSIYDNPYLLKDAIAEFEALLTEDEKQCRLYGIPLHLSGLIYKEFSWDKHVLKDLPLGWTSYENPPLDYTIYTAVDPHPQTPHAVLYCALNALGQKFYFVDTFRHCSIADLSADIRRVHFGRHALWTKVDPIAYINDPITETNMAYEFERHGVCVERATKDLSTGILKVQEMLAAPAGQTFFTPACRRTLWEIQRYCWDEKENRPLDKDDHMMENLYRLELSGMRYVPREDPSNKPVEDEAIVGRPNLDLRDISFAL